jgi:hypothetical protein
MCRMLALRKNDGKTSAIHVDEYRMDSQLLGIWCKLDNCTCQSELAVVLSLPKFICSSILRVVPCSYCSMLTRCTYLFSSVCFLVRNLLNWRHYFSKSCWWMKTQNTKIPVLFMTATANQTILSQLEHITGYTFENHNMFWPPTPQMLEPKVQMTFWYMPMPMLVL